MGLVIVVLVLRSSVWRHLYSEQQEQGNLEFCLHNNQSVFKRSWETETRSNYYLTLLKAAIYFFLNYSVHFRPSLPSSCSCSVLCVQEVGCGVSGLRQGKRFMQQQKWEIVQNVETLLLESGAGMGKLP